MQHNTPDFLQLRLILAAIMICARVNLWAADSDSMAAAAPPHFRHESEFIVQAIASDLAEQIYYARQQQAVAPRAFAVTVAGRPATAAGAPVFAVDITLASNLPALHCDIALTNTIWSPESYQELTSKLAERVGLHPGNTANGGDAGLLLGLTDGSAATIELEDQSLSQALQKDFTNPHLHEQAAVLLGAFALRDHAGRFFDARHPLCRMTTHIAMARFLGGGSAATIDGRLAQVMLLTLMHNQTAALKELDQLIIQDAGTAAWSKTLYALNTGDYRRLNPTNNLSAVERIAWFAAYGQSVGIDQAWQKLGDEKQKWPDYNRIALSETFTVEMGHELLPQVMPMEAKEFQTIMGMCRKEFSGRPTMTEALNAPPQRCVTLDAEGHTNLHVIGWGLWAQLLQHQTCAAVAELHDFLLNGWGVPDEAAVFANECNQSFGGLQLYPFTRLPPSPATVSPEHDITRLIDTAPQSVPAGCWITSDMSLFSQMVDWFSPAEPTGTAYDFEHRVGPIRSNSGSAVSQLNRLHALAPYDVYVVQTLMNMDKFTETNTEAVSNLVSLSLPFSVAAITLLANAERESPVQYESMMTAAARLNPNLYFRLGDYFREHDDPDHAAEAYDQGDDAGADSLLSASVATWRVDYNLGKGRREKARHIAEIAGEVYSYAGLMAKAHFLEATGDYINAFNWYSNIEERYGKGQPLQDFCLRAKGAQSDPQFSRVLDRYLANRTAKLFPHGMEKVALANFQQPPADGVEIEGPSEPLRKAGLKPLEVIVAVNGVRVHSIGQYLFARIDATRTDMDLIFWDGRGYHEVTANPPNHLFGVALANYGAYSEKNAVIHPQLFHLEGGGAISIPVKHSPPPDMNQLDADGNTGLLRAASKGEFYKMAELVRLGADVRATNHQGQTVLHLAIIHGAGPEELEDIMKAKPDVNAQDRDGFAPLHALATARNTEKESITRMLLLAGANPNLRDKQGRTPVHLFLSGPWPWSGAAESLDALAKAGADMSARDDAGKTPLHYLAALGSEQPLFFIHGIDKTLVAAQVDFRAVDHRGETAADIAAKKQASDILDWLVDQGVSLDVTNSLGASPRQVAAHGSGFFATTPQLNFYEAIQQNRTDCLLLLIKACPELMNGNGHRESPLAFAIKRHQTNAIVMLKQYGAHE